MTRWCTFAAIAVVALVAARPARAHLGSTKLVWLEVGASEVRATIDLDPIDVAYELEADDPDHATPERLLSRGEEIGAWARAKFSVHTESSACAPAVESLEAVDVEGALRMTRAVRVTVSFTCDGAPVRFEDDAVFDSDAQHEAIVRVGDAPTILRRGRQEVALVAPSLGDTAWTFLVEGAIHLVTGYDHILFLLSLLLVAGELAREKGTRAAVRDVALMVTAFTLGHSVTLILAALDVVALPSRLVESAIAASIVAVAVWNFVRPEARVGLRWVAGVFGLVHGFGFSSVLRELLLPAGQRVTALLMFNLGIELAQLAIVVVVVPLLGWLAASRRYRAVVVRGGSALIGLAGLWWLIQRAFGL